MAFTDLYVCMLFEPIEELQPAGLCLWFIERSFFICLDLRLS